MKKIAMKSALATSSLLAAAVSAGAHAEERFALFDLGSLDTLIALGASDQVVGYPKQTMPGYLSSLEEGDYTDIGGLKTPDLDALAESEPTLIVYTGRQGEHKEALEAIAPLFDAGLTGDDYLAAFDDNVRTLAEHAGLESEAEDALETLHNEIETQREALADAPRTLVVTHNDGNYSLNEHPVIHELLGVEKQAMPDGVEAETFGERSFTRLSPEAIAEIDPERLLIIDRSAAIGQQPLDADELRQQLEEAGAANAEVAVLSPALWYLSGGGLQSLSLQIDEVVSALGTAPAS
ncbi:MULTISPECIES: ABC transporter substrate-binding protein [unclassified Halomonas]|uniref:ABC transporter substrate-binding protein n=1 Tax=unclassified Halomonas TaxID=2609666 RepID=UPI0021E385E9|nr:MULTISPECIES: ABC transporter substrate-binding protein [unclassified Halomonas]UYG00337.1 ABC transporter substrate-binding protein [Halomonas sp. GD1P12]WNL38588.1 ABC transporter substrate-binding protein [Halomonas sp. PAMB 3232]